MASGDPTPSAPFFSPRDAGRGLDHRLGAIMTPGEGCEQCGHMPGTVEAATLAAVDELSAGSPLNGVERALAQSAHTLARAIDTDDGDHRQLAGLTRELRATLKQLADAMPVLDDDAEDDSGPA